MKKTDLEKWIFRHNGKIVDLKAHLTCEKIINVPAYMVCWEGLGYNRQCWYIQLGSDVMVIWSRWSIFHLLKIKYAEIAIDENDILIVNEVLEREGYVKDHGNAPYDMIDSGWIRYDPLRFHELKIGYRRVALTTTNLPITASLYTIKKQLGRGGMGTVFLVEDATGKSFVMKLIDLPDQETKERVEREVATLRQIQDKQGKIPEIFDYIEENGQGKIIMEYIQGEDLQAFFDVDNSGVMVPEKQIKKVLLQALDILELIHSQQPPIVHRDIKPANLIYTKNGIVLIDFGIARSVKQGSSTIKTAIGTPGYASPEHYQGKPEPASDIYSLGATIHHIATKQAPLVPFQFPLLETVRKDFSHSLCEIINRMLSFPISIRPSLLEIRQAIENPRPNSQNSPKFPPTVPASSHRWLSIRNQIDIHNLCGGEIMKTLAKENVGAFVEFRYYRNSGDSLRRYYCQDLEELYLKIWDYYSKYNLKEPWCIFKEDTSFSPLEPVFSFDYDLILLIEDCGLGDPTHRSAASIHEVCPKCGGRGTAADSLYELLPHPSLKLECIRCYTKWKVNYETNRQTGYKPFFTTAEIEDDVYFSSLHQGD